VWEPFSSSHLPYSIAALDASVTCIRWRPYDTSSTDVSLRDKTDMISSLVASTTNGAVCLMSLVTTLPGKNGRSNNVVADHAKTDTPIELQEDIGPTVSVVSVYNFQAHEAIPDLKDSNFGSLILYAEVWSICWGPHDRPLFIATTSEDQTVRVWDVHNFFSMSEGVVACKDKVSRVTTLTGHKAAVTSVDWQHTAMGELLVSCADDRTVRVWRVDGWRLLYVFDTLCHVPLTEWHTLTYIALPVHGRHVACGAQNGFLFVWPLPKAEDELPCREQMTSDSVVLALESETIKSTVHIHNSVSTENDHISNKGPTSHIPNTINPIFAHKVHSGSIEGLRWWTPCVKEDYTSRAQASAMIVTCSSDCTVNVMDALY